MWVRRKLPQKSKSPYDTRVASKQLRDICLPTPHAGQQRILDEASRFNVIRCGRRFGKTILGEHEAGRLASPPLSKKVGWFAPTYKIFIDAWDELVQIVRPGIRRLSQQEKRIEMWGGGLIEGWSLDTDDPGRSRDYDLVIIDEAGMVVNLKKLWRQAIRPTLVDRKGGALFLGTPRVVCPDFNEMFDGAMEHTKGYDEDSWRAFNARTLDNPFIDADEIRAAQEELEEWEYLQEYEGVPADVSSAFFSAKEIEAHRERHACEPFFRCAIAVDEPDTNKRDFQLTQRRLKAVQMVEDNHHGPWRMWTDLHEGRPPQGRRYAFAADLGAGVGSSNTVISVGDIGSRRKIAEYVSSRVTPDEAARLTIAAATWFGGSEPAVVNFEVNGSTGELYYQEMVRLGYPRLWRTKIGGARADASHSTSELHYGWRSSERAKHELLGQYRMALYSDRFINPSNKALDECRMFRIDKFGRIINDQRANDPLEEIARVPHGDRVISDAILHLTMGTVEASPKVNTGPTPGSVQDRYNKIVAAATPKIGW